jgi:hypothetical protein
MNINLKEHRNNLRLLDWMRHLERGGSSSRLGKKIVAKMVKGFPSGKEVAST